MLTCVQCGMELPDNANFAKGRYFHQLVLEPEKAVGYTFVESSSRNTKLYKEYCAEAEVCSVIGSIKDCKDNNPERPPMLCVGCGKALN